MSWVFTSQWDQKSPQNLSNNGTLKSSWVLFWVETGELTGLKSSSFPGFSGFQRKMNEWMNTLPETNIAPENWPLEKEIPIGNHHF